MFDFSSFRQFSYSFYCVGKRITNVISADFNGIGDFKSCLFAFRYISFTPNGTLHNVQFVTEVQDHLMQCVLCRKSSMVACVQPRPPLKIPLRFLLRGGAAVQRL